MCLMCVFISGYSAVLFEGTLFDIRPDGPDTENTMTDTERLPRD